MRSNTPSMKLTAPTPAPPRALPSDREIAEAIVRHLVQRREAQRLARELAAAPRA